MRSQLATLAATPDVLAAVAAGNNRHAAMDEAAILVADAEWRAEVGTTNDGMITAMTESPASAALRAMVEASNGQITEIIVMDNKGMNAAISAVTSDYWQGDEAKFQETYPKGAAAIHVAEIEFDESSQIYQQQISVTLVDPALGQPVGAVTFGLDAGAFY
ncbi:hypothetical protein [Oceaniglobus roseus]|uniref:hypothetical protein n=1 Tax=Oceaniglobus roseus TaxID=1737570 RepID=UPI001C12ABE0|nr:hypothetical protein [Kandeliimicrobium roseum]